MVKQDGTVIWAPSCKTTSAVIKARVGITMNNHQLVSSHSSGWIAGTALLEPLSGTSCGYNGHEYKPISKCIAVGPRHVHCWQNLLLIELQIKLPCTLS